MCKMGRTIGRLRAERHYQASLLFKIFSGSLHRADGFRGISQPDDVALVDHSPLRNLAKQFAELFKLLCRWERTGRQESSCSPGSFGNKGRIAPYIEGGAGEQGLCRK